MNVTTQKIGTKMCEALGLDPAYVQRITFDWDAGGMATIWVQHLVRDVGEISHVWKQYTLEEKETPEGED